MSFTDPIGDFLTRMRNAQHGRHTTCRAPWSRMKEQIASLLQKNGYLASVSVEGEGIHREVVVEFVKDRPALTLKRLSKPGGRKYVQSSEIRTLLHGSALAIISTSQGLLTDAEARKQNVGGEILCTIS